jgi:hypothetical protein
VVLFDVPDSAQEKAATEKVKADAKVKIWLRINCLSLIKEHKRERKVAGFKKFLFLLVIHSLSKPFLCG